MPRGPTPDPLIEATRRGFTCRTCGEYFQRRLDAEAHVCDARAAAEKQDDIDANAEHAIKKPTRRKRAKATKS